MTRRLDRARATVEARATAEVQRAVVAVDRRVNLAESVLRAGRDWPGMTMAEAEAVFAPAGGLAGWGEVCDAARDAGDAPSPAIGGVYVVAYAQLVARGERYLWPVADMAKAFGVPSPAGEPGAATTG